MMFITIPEDKHLKMLVDATGATIQAWEADDPEAPTQPNGDAMPIVDIEFARDFLRRMLLVDASWGTSVDKLYIGMELRTVFHKVKPGETVELTEEQHKALVAVMKTPTVQYNAAVGMLLGDFFRAIEHAAPKPPRKEKPAPKPPFSSKGANGQTDAK